MGLQKDHDWFTGEYLVNPWLHVVPCGPGEFLVKHGARSRISRLLTDTTGTGLLGRVLGASGPTSVQAMQKSGQIQDSEIRAVVGLLETLAAEDIVVAAGTPTAHARLALTNGSSTVRE